MTKREMNYGLHYDTPYYFVLCMPLVVLGKFLVRGKLEIGLRFLKR